jgi:hypothetical protein
MRRQILVAASLVLVAGLLLPYAAVARRDVVLGSLTIVRKGGAALSGEVVGVATISNPGFEKNINQQVPPYVLPVFVDTETDGSSAAAGPRILHKHFETTVLLTNTTAIPLELDLTLRAGAGAIKGTAAVLLPANGTAAVALSDLVTVP